MKDNSNLEQENPNSFNIETNQVVTELPKDFVPREELV